MKNPYLTNDNLSFEIESDDPYYKILQSIAVSGTSLSADTAALAQWGYKHCHTTAREGVALALNHELYVVLVRGIRKSSERVRSAA